VISTLIQVPISIFDNEGIIDLTKTPEAPENAVKSDNYSDNKTMTKYPNGTQVFDHKNGTRDSFTTDGNYPDTLFKKYDGNTLIYIKKSKNDNYYPN